MRSDGRADHIEDYLVTVRTGQWFGWTDSKNKIYANLVVNDSGTKPTEKECTDGLAALQMRGMLNLIVTNLKEEQNIQVLKNSLITSIIMV